MRNLVTTVAGWPLRTVALSCVTICATACATEDTSGAVASHQGATASTASPHLPDAASDASEQPDGAIPAHSSAPSESTDASDTIPVVNSADAASSAFQPTDGAAPSASVPNLETGVSEECFSLTENVLLAGLIPGCSCEEGEDPLETCLRAGALKLPAWCEDGRWQVETTMNNGGLAWDLCTGSADPLSDAGSLCEPALVSVADVGDAGMRVNGAPVCVGQCGYRYSPYSSEDYNYEYDANIACPVAAPEVCAKLAPLFDEPVLCEVDSDCQVIVGHPTKCEPEWDTGIIFQSTSEQGYDYERYVNADRWLAAGCGKPYLGFDGPGYEPGCVAGVCDLVQAAYCGAPLEPSDAGSTDTGP